MEKERLPKDQKLQLLQATPRTNSFKRCVLHKQTLNFNIPYLIKEETYAIES